MNAKAGAKLFVVLYFVLLISMLYMTSGADISAFAAIPIIGSAEAIVMTMLYLTIFFGHHEDHEADVPHAAPVREPAAHSMAHG